MSIAPQPFYRGNPNDGTVLSNSTDNVQVNDLGCQVPGYGKWLITEITVTNMTQSEGFFSVAIFPSSVITSTFQPGMGTVNTHVPLPQSNAGGPGFTVLGTYIAYSQPVPPVSTLILPCHHWALDSEKLWAGVFPGYNALVGAGGVGLTISGRDYTP